MAHALVIVGIALLVTAVHPVVCQIGGSVGTIISNSDPSISYAPALCTARDATECFGAWWDTSMNDGTVVKTTTGPSAQYENAQTMLSFSFHGTRIELHGMRDAAGATMLVQLDGEVGAVNTSTGADGAEQQAALLASFTGLDAETAHTLTVGWYSSKFSDPDSNSGESGKQAYAYFDHFVVGDFSAVGNSASTSSSQSSPTSTISSTSSKSHSLSPGAIAGIVLGLLAFLAFISFLPFGRYRRRASAARVDRVTIDAQEDWRMDGGRISGAGVGSDTLQSPVSTASQATKTNVKAYPHMSLPPAYFTLGRAAGKDGKEGKDARGATYGEADTDACAYNLKGVSYLDLESGENDVGGSGDGASLPARSERPHDRRSQRNRKVYRKSRRALFPVPLPPLSLPEHADPHPHASGLTFPPTAHLRLSLGGTREEERAQDGVSSAGSASSRDRNSQVRGKQTQATQELENLSPPCTPCTSYCVDTATRTTVRPQNALFVRRSRIPVESGASTSLSRKQTQGIENDAPLPPLPSPNPREGKRRLARAYTNDCDARVPAPIQVSDTINLAGSPCDKAALELDLSLSAMTLASTSSHSLPPPYALHP